MMRPTLLLVRGHWDPERDAVSRAAAQLLVALKMLGFEYSIATHAGLVERNGVLREINSRVLRRAGTRAFRATLAMYSAVIRELRGQGNNLVVITLDDPLSAPPVVRALRWLVARRSTQISWVMDMPHTQGLLLGQDKSPAVAMSWLRSVVERRSHLLADHVVSLGDCMRLRLATSGRRRLRQSVIPIWQPDIVDAACTDASDRPSTLRVLYSGQATHRHPLSAIGEAARRLDGVRPVEFHFVAWGPEVDRLRAYVVKHSLCNVYFHDRGGRPEGEILDSGDVHLVSLHPSSTGTCVPSKAYAAMMMGRPVLYLGSPEGQAARDIESSAGGAVIDADDAERLITELTRLESPEVRATVGAAGRAHFETDHTVEVGARRWATLISVLASATSERPTTAAAAPAPASPGDGIA